MKKLLLCLVVLVLLFGCTGVNENKTKKNKTIDSSIEDNVVPAPTGYCNDSDGRDIYKEGFVTFGSNRFADHCLNITTLEENFCNDNLADSQNVDCSSGYQCYFGKCVLKNRVTCVSNSNSDLYIKGSVEVNGKISADECTGMKNVRKYTCNGNEAASAIFECPNKSNCVDGKCIRKEVLCTDSDGYNISSFGKVTVDDNSGFLEVLEDKCTNNILTEYYCNGNMSAYDLVNCPTLTHCTNGYCIPDLNSTGCTDSDGITREIAGSVVVSGIFYQDNCVSNSNVLEYYCQNNEIRSAVLSCAVISGNSTCMNSRCTIN